MPVSPPEARSLLPGLASFFEVEVAIPPDIGVGELHPRDMQISGLPVPLDLDPGAKRIQVTEPHAAPCRRCLSDAEPGEVVLLTSYDPWRVRSPYRQAGPVFVHERDCAPTVCHEVPDQLRRRLLSVRGYDEQGYATRAEVVPGEDAQRLLEEMLGEPDTAFVHVHNAAPGCFAARVDGD